MDAPTLEVFRNFEKGIYYMVLKLSVAVHSSLAAIFDMLTILHAGIIKCTYGQNSIN